MSVVPVPKVLAGDIFVDRLVRFEPGSFSGFGQEFLPDIVLGGPEGSGLREGSFDVVSLGHGGQIVVSFADNLVWDGPGDDLIIFENAFFATGDDTVVFDELAFVEVSANGRDYVRFPHDLETRVGLAGWMPVFSNSLNGVGPLDLDAGGDRFDLSDVGLPFVRYVRVIDGGDALPDLGNLAFPGSKGGFDLDAVAAIHSVAPGTVSGTVRVAGEVAAGIRVKLFAPDGTKRRRRTREEGEFRFRRLIPEGQYLVRARVRGIGKDEHAMELSAEDYNQSVDLDPHR